MEFYTKISSSSPAAAVSETKDSLEVNIKSGKKIRACISQALKSLQSSKDKVVIIGSGPTVTKAITTAEIVKRKIKGLHQQNNLYYTKNEDVWEPKEEGLDQLKVTRNVPSISITLSFQPLDDQAPGYQAPGVYQPLVQFRDEDIELADERIEGKHETRQAQHKQTNKRKVGIKRERTQGHQTSHEVKDNHDLDNATQIKKSASKKPFKKKYKGPKPSEKKQPDKNV